MNAVYIVTKIPMIPMVIVEYKTTQHHLQYSNPQTTYFKGKNNQPDISHAKAPAQLPDACPWRGRSTSEFQCMLRERVASQRVHPQPGGYPRRKGLEPLLSVVLVAPAVPVAPVAPEAVASSLAAWCWWYRARGSSCVPWVPEAVQGAQGLEMPMDWVVVAPGPPSSGPPARWPTWSAVPVWAAQVVAPCGAMPPMLPAVGGCHQGAGSDWNEPTGLAWGRVGELWELWQLRRRHKANPLHQAWGWGEGMLDPDQVATPEGVRTSRQRGRQVVVGPGRWGWARKEGSQQMGVQTTWGQLKITKQLTVYS